MKGIEPPTPSLPWKCSTPELHWQNTFHCLRDHHFHTLILCKKCKDKKLNLERETRLEPATLSLEG